MTRELSGRQLEDLVAWQLGRPAIISFRTAAGCSFDWPAVISSAPFRDDGAPNPNILYLTCPYLRHEISVLEDRGAIRELEAVVAGDGRLTENLVAAQRRHAGSWREAAGVEWPGGPPEAPRIAAAAGDTALKCLHAHMAWYLIHPEHMLGRIIEDRIGARWCSEDRCAGFQQAEEGGLDRA